MANSNKGTIYIFPDSSRTNWFGSYAEYLNIPLNVVDAKTVDDFEKKFPLHKVPALITDKGVKLTEALAIIYYLTSISEKKELLGSNIDETSQVIRWLAFINQDLLITAGDYRFRSKTEEEKSLSFSRLKSLFVYINNELKSRKYLALDSRITVADIFAFNIINKLKSTIPIDEFEAVVNWSNEISNHPVYKK